MRTKAVRLSKPVVQPGAQPFMRTQFRLLAPAIGDLEIGGARIAIDARGSRNALECKDRSR
jgi:hypothetical protein